MAGAGFRGVKQEPLLCTVAQRACLALGHRAEDFRQAEEKSSDRPVWKRYGLLQVNPHPRRHLTHAPSRQRPWCQIYPTQDDTALLTMATALPVSGNARDIICEQGQTDTLCPSVCQSDDLQNFHAASLSGDSVDMDREWLLHRLRGRVPSISSGHWRFRRLQQV